jgi:hypothetical protein
MKKILLLAVLVMLTSALALSQDVPKWEVFGGYSYLRVNPGFGADGVDTSGWEAAANYNISHSWGLKADVSGHYCCDGEHMHNFLFGPQFAFRSQDNKWTVFAHGLIGASHADSIVSDTSVAWAAGGGFDWYFHNNVGWRVAQVDYLGTHFLDDTQSNVRVSTGVVFRFGKR